MHKLEEPIIAFQKWQPWSKRPRLSDCVDVPPDFDLGGLYLFAHFSNTKEPAMNMDASHLLPDVIYIGMSQHLTGRTQSHKKISNLYKTKFEDPQCEFLYFTHCDFGYGWHSRDLTHGSLARSKLAYVQYAERKLIWEYAREFNRLPSLNLK